MSKSYSLFSKINFFGATCLIFSELWKVIFSEFIKSRICLLTSGPAAGSVIGAGVKKSIWTESRTPLFLSIESTSKLASKGAGGHL